MRQDEIGRERDKTILEPNSVHTQPGGENSDVIFSPNGMRQAEKERRILDPNSAHTRPGGENSEKKQQKN